MLRGLKTFHTRAVIYGSRFEFYLKISYLFFFLPSLHLKYGFFSRIDFYQSVKNWNNLIKVTQTLGNNEKNICRNIIFHEPETIKRDM